MSVLEGKPLRRREDPILTTFRQKRPEEAQARDINNERKRAWKRPVCRDISVPGATQTGDGASEDDFFTS